MAKDANLSKIPSLGIYVHVYWASNCLSRGYSNTSACDIIADSGIYLDVLGAISVRV